MDQAQGIRQSKKARFAWALLGLNALVALGVMLLAAFGRPLDNLTVGSLVTLLGGTNLFAAPYLLGQSAVDYAKARGTGGA